MSSETESSVDQEQPFAARLGKPLLVAAIVVLVVGALTLVLSPRGGEEAPRVASPPSPSGNPSAGSTPSSAGPGDRSIPATAPEVPLVVDGRLYADGAPVPGDWWMVESRGEVWLAQRRDGSWWYGGPGLDPDPIDAQLNQPPVISPNGWYVAFVDLSGGRAHLTGFDTRSAGEGFGVAPIDLPSAEGGVPIRVRAVTDDGDVIVQGRRTSLMWRALHQDQQTVIDLSETAPGQQVQAGTPAGLVVVNGIDADPQSAEPYLADLSVEGRLSKTGTVPTYDDLAISPGGTWLVRSPAGSLGGEVTSVETLSAQPVASGDEVTLHAPDDGSLAVGTWTWEDDRTFIAVLLPDGAATQPAVLARCDVTVGACRAVALPGVRVAVSSAEATLDAVVEAVVVGDRASLPDPSVVGDREWDQLVGFAAGGGGSASGCRDNGGGTRDCEIDFEADAGATFYAIVEPAENAHGWRISYVSIADG